MSKIEQMLARSFHCQRCSHRGATARKLAMSGTGLSRLFEIQPYRYAFVSCTNCGHTEVFDLRVLDGKDNLGTVLEILFAN